MLCCRPSKSSSKPKRLKRKKLRRTLEHASVAAFEQLLFGNHYLLVKALHLVVDPSKVNEVSTALAIVYFHRGESLRLLEDSIKFEVATASSPGTLMRANSVTTKLMSVQSRLLGSEWLHIVLQEPIEKIMAAKNSYFEVDPHKLGDDNGDAQTNMGNLMGFVTDILDSLFAHVNDCPLQLRQIAKILFNEVRQGFPTKRFPVLGGYLFLRFVNPGLLTPQNYGLLKADPPARVRRALVLASKVIQSLANGRQFGDKEGYLGDMNILITDYLVPLRQFYNKLMKVNVPYQFKIANRELPKNPASPFTDHDHLHALSQLYKFVAEKQPYVINALELMTDGYSLPGGEGASTLRDRLSSMNKGGDEASYTFRSGPYGPDPETPEAPSEDVKFLIAELTDQFPPVDISEIARRLESGTFVDSRMVPAAGATGLVTRKATRTGKGGVQLLRRAAASGEDAKQESTVNLGTDIVREDVEAEAARGHALIEESKTQKQRRLEEGKTQDDKPSDGSAGKRRSKSRSKSPGSKQEGGGDPMPPPESS